MESIVLGGGCFWCLDAAYRRIKGVDQVTSGYAGGKWPDPTYERVCTGTTGHAEVVKVEFNEKLINLETILEIFWTLHDPTILNRQGNDVGTQYRSIILFNSPEQEAVIKDSLTKTAVPYGVIASLLKSFLSRNSIQPRITTKIISTKIPSKATAKSLSTQNWPSSLKNLLSSSKTRWHYTLSEFSQTINHHKVC